MRQFLFKLSLCSPILLGMVGINWAVDPGRFYVSQGVDPSRNPAEFSLIGDLRARRPHRMTAVYNERVVIEQVFRDRPEIDVLVLGSSVSKPIHQKMFVGQSFFNASIYGGELEEAVAVYQLAWEHRLRPKRVVLQLQGFGRFLGRRVIGLTAGLNPVLPRAHIRLGFVDENLLGTMAAYMSAQDAAGQFVVEAGLAHPYDNLISPRYLQLSLQSLIRTWSSPRSTGLPVEEYAARDQRVIYPDGSVEWAPSSLVRTPMEVRVLSEQRLRTFAASDDQRPSRVRCKLLEAFVLDLLHSGTEVEIVLTPPAVSFFDRVQEVYAKARKALPSVETDDYVRAFAARHRVRVVGSFDPRKAGLDDAAFVDYIHLRRDVFPRFWSAPARD